MFEILKRLSDLPRTRTQAAAPLTEEKAREYAEAHTGFDGYYWKKTKTVFLVPKGYSREDDDGDDIP